MHISEELTESLVKGAINKNRFDIFWKQKLFNFLTQRFNIKLLITIFKNK